MIRASLAMHEETRLVIWQFYGLFFLDVSMWYFINVSANQVISAKQHILNLCHLLTFRAAGSNAEAQGWYIS